MKLFENIFTPTKLRNTAKNKHESSRILEKDQRGS